MLAGLAPARRRLVLGLALVVVAGLAVSGGVLVPRLRSHPTAAVAQGHPGPVLLVPGYGGATGGLEDLAARLRAAGRDAVVVHLPGDGTGDLAAGARALAAAVRAARGATGAASVDVVGYSAGGIIARLWVADGGAAQARRIITLGSPHHGTDLAALAGGLLPGECPAGCRELAPGSALLQRLDSGDETPAGPTWVSFWTTADRTVQPPDSARLAGALDVPVQAVCATSRVDHGELPTDPLVQNMVLAELGPGPLVPLGPADCARLSAPFPVGTPRR